MGHARKKSKRCSRGKRNNNRKQPEYIEKSRKLRRGKLISKRMLTRMGRGQTARMRGVRRLKKGMLMRK